jgi:RNA polymerase sigma-70 factor, ECF subfamily
VSAAVVESRSDIGEEHQRGSDADDDRRLLRGVLEGDEAAFERLVRKHQAPLLRFLRAFVDRAAAAEDVAQETWVAVLRGADGFEQRATFKTWLYGIAVHRAQSHVDRERRQERLERAIVAEIGARDHAVDRARFLPNGDARYPAHWETPPADWGDHPEARLLSRETAELLADQIDELPPAQAAVLMLRDIEGLDRTEVCGLLGISDGNQRVLLHRARTTLWRALESHLAEQP